MNNQSGTPTKRRVRAAGFVIVVGSLLIPMAPANAETAEGLEVTAQAWSWSSNQRFTFTAKDPGLGLQETIDVARGGGTLAAVPGGLSPISPYHLGVSMINGVSDMRTFVRWNLASIPEGSKIKSFDVSFTLSHLNQAHLQQHFDNNARVPFTAGHTFARVDACPVTDTLTGGEANPTSTFSFQRPEIEKGSTDINREDEANEPKYDCGLNRVRGRISKDGNNLNFDLKDIAQRWLDDSNEGLVLIGAAEGAATSWVLELHGAPATLAAQVGGVPVSPPGVSFPEAPEQEPNTYVREEDQVVASASYTPGPPADSNDGGNGGGEVIRETVVVNQPGTSETVVVNQPGTSTTQVVYAGPPGTVGQLPVGDIATPGWMYLGIPFGLLAMGAIFGAVGTDTATAGVSVAGSRVATLLRRRRLDS